MGKIPRIYLKPEQFRESQVELSKEHRHYLERVLRLKVGEEFAALDGAGQAWLCRLEAQGHGHFVEHFPAVSPHPCRLTLGVALCKGSRFETAIESLAELGVTRLVPLITERSERKSPSHQRMERWKTIALSASAVAYRSVPMVVESSCRLEDLVNDLEGEAVFCHPDGVSPTSLLCERRENLTLLIGPEGGFTDAEVALLSGRLKKMSLGPTNLRVATAATVSAGLALTLQAEECGSFLST